MSRHQMATVENLGVAMTKRLAGLEAQIEYGLRAFVRVGEALTEIRDQHLYAQGYSSFDEYVRFRWHMSRQQAYRLIDAAFISGVLTKGGAQAPKHEAHARALAPLKADPKRLQTVWTAVNAEHGEEVTAEVVAKAVRASLTGSDTPTRPSTPDPEPEAREPLASIHVAVDLDKQQARDALDALLDLPTPPCVGLLTIRAQLEAQLAVL